MNRTYRTVWNESLGAWVAASELDSARGKGNRSASVRILASLLLLGVVQFSYAGTYTGSDTCNSPAATSPDGARALPAGGAPINGNGAWSSVAGCGANGGGALYLGVTLFGSFTTATGNGAVALGTSAQAGQWGSALGLDATASGIGASAFGYGSTASGTGSIAIGGTNQNGGVGAATSGRRDRPGNVRRP